VRVDKGLTAAGKYTVTITKGSSFPNGNTTGGHTTTFATASGVFGINTCASVVHVVVTSRQGDTATFDRGPRGA